MMRRLRTRLLLAATAASLLVLAGVLPAQEPERSDPPKPYANTPEELVPFRRSGPPHQRFFTERQAYRGPRERKPGDEGGPVRVGLLLPGGDVPDARRAAMIRRGVEMAFAEAAAAPEARHCELVVTEDAPLWGSSANGMVDLCAREGVVAVIGSVDGAASHIALRVALKAGVFMVNTATCDPTLTETAIPWLLRCYPDGRQHAYRLALLIAKERRCQRVAVLRVNDRYGRMGIMEVVHGLRRLGSPVRIEMRFQPGARDFTAQVARIRSMEPDAVVLWGDAPDLAHAARALRAGGVEAPFFGNDRLVDPAFVEIAGSAAEGTTATYPFDPGRKDPSWIAFRERFREVWGCEPDLFAAYAYDGARILLEAVECVGPDRVALRDALAALETWEGVTGPMEFDTTHNNVAPLRTARITDGRFVFE
jgi:ABC-type branched-subunit amino acid transport system substrate-binding protein